MHICIDGISINVINPIVYSQFISMFLHRKMRLLAIVLTMAACSKENDAPKSQDELGGLKHAATITNEDHKIELYTAKGNFISGYNEIALQIKDKNGNLIPNASISWEPVMQMMSMSHSCPYSAISRKDGARNTYGGYIIFQMAGNDMEHWQLTIHYSINGQEYSAVKQIDVLLSNRQQVQSFMGSDNERYVLALVEPSAPKVAVNNMSVALYRMKSMMEFEIVDGYTVEIDPRMPSMGNHGSPNNVHLVQGADKFYHGKLSLTMTGYWKINLRLLDASGNPLKGEELTGEQESSSLYFEIEF
jgi:hypothetical protein